MLGPEFTAALLAAMLGTRPAALRRLSTSFSPATLCTRAARQTRGTFRFRHALIQEATYLGLLRAERREATRARRGGGGSRIAGRLPRSPRSSAAITLPPGTPAALHYLELAGDHATDAFANDEAISSFNAALAVLTAAPPDMPPPPSGCMPSSPTCCGASPARRG